MSTTVYESHKTGLHWARDRFKQSHSFDVSWKYAHKRKFFLGGHENDKFQGDSSDEFFRRIFTEGDSTQPASVARCIASAIVHGIEDPVPEAMTNEELASLLFPRTERRSFTSSFATPDFERLAEELKKPHVTKKLLWKEYLDANRNSGQRIYSITQFNVLLNDYIESHNISIRRASSFLRIALTSCT